MPEFRYFAEPQKYGDYVAAEECSFCGKTRGGHRLPVSVSRMEDGADEDDNNDEGEAEALTFICEECLAEGELDDEEIALNTGDMEALREQLTQLNPRATVRAIAEMVEERYSELAERTPAIKGAPQFLWPAHCGDFCRFERPIGERGIGGVGGAQSDYLFRCLTCGESIRV